MRVSLNEIEKLCEKAACGAGIPAGVDSDIGFGAAWLEARGLPGVAGVARDLANQTGLTWHRVDEAERSGDAGGRSLLSHAGSLVDLATADALREQGTVRSIVLANAGSSLFLIPVAVARRGGCAFRITWAPPEVVVIVDGRNRAAVYAQSADELDSSEVSTLRIDAVIGHSNFEAPPALPLLYSPETLDKRLAKSLNEGVVIDAATWDQLQKLAARTLVPASAESRSRGAGAEIDDNE